MLDHAADTVKTVYITNYHDVSMFNKFGSDELATIAFLKVHDIVAQMYWNEFDLNLIAYTAGGHFTSSGDNCPHDSGPRSLCSVNSSSNCKVCNYSGFNYFLGAPGWTNQPKQKQAIWTYHDICMWDGSVNSDFSGLANANKGKEINEFAFKLDQYGNEIIDIDLTAWYFAHELAHLFGTPDHSHNPPDCIVDYGYFSNHPDIEDIFLGKTNENIFCTSCRAIVQAYKDSL